MKFEPEIQSAISKYEADLVILNKQREEKGESGIGIEILKSQITNYESVVGWLKWVLEPTKLKPVDFISSFAVYFVDTDPDTGKISQMKLVSEMDIEFYAEFLSDGLNKTNDEPNRKYYYTKL